MYVKQFVICLSVVVILLFNLMEVFNVGGGALLDRPCMIFQRMCLLCLCLFHFNVSVCRKLSPHLAV